MTDRDVARAMLLREALASTRLDRGDDGTINLGPQVSQVPHPGEAWDGMEWDAVVQGWLVKDAPDGRLVWVVRYMFTAAVIIGPPDAWEYDDRWCYATPALAATCARAWSAEPGTEPDGWHRHPNTGRRRPDGDPATEYLMP